MKFQSVEEVVATTTTTATSHSNAHLHSRHSQQQQQQQQQQHNHHQQQLQQTQQQQQQQHERLYLHREPPLYAVETSRHIAAPAPAADENIDRDWENMSNCSVSSDGLNESLSSVSSASYSREDDDDEDSIATAELDDDDDDDKHVSNSSSRLLQRKRSADDLTRSTSCNTSSTIDEGSRHVRFSVVQVQEYAITFGDHPCAHEVPISLDWDHSSVHEMELSDFEELSKQRQKRLCRAEQQQQMYPRTVCCNSSNDNNCSTTGKPTQGSTDTSCLSRRPRPLTALQRRQRLSRIGGFTNEEMKAKERQRLEKLADEKIQLFLSDIEDEVDRDFLKQENNEDDNDNDDCGDFMDEWFNELIADQDLLSVDNILHKLSR